MKEEEFKSVEVTKSDMKSGSDAGKYLKRRPDIYNQVGGMLYDEIYKWFIRVSLGEFIEKDEVVRVIEDVLEMFHNKYEN
jgi:hypothetical protein